MKSYTSREILKILKEAGWIEKGDPRGSHHYLIHPDKPELGKVTVPHPKKNIPAKTLQSISKHTGVFF